MIRSDILRVNRKTWLWSLAISTLLLGLLYFGAPVWIPLIFSFFLFMLLAPIVDWFERRRVSGALTSLFLVILSVVFITGILWVGYASVKKIALNMPRYESRLQEFRDRVYSTAPDSTHGFLPGESPATSWGDRRSVQKVEVVEKPSTLFLSSPIWAGVNSALGIISVIFFIPIITLVMLWERRALQSRFEGLFARPDVFRVTCHKLRDMTYGFFFGNFVVGLGMAALFSTLFFFLGLEDFLVYGLTCGFLNLLPVFGPLMGACLPVIQALIQFPVTWPAWLILASSVLVHFLSANLLIPKFVGGKVNLNATAATIGLLFWGALWGMTGLFLAIPLTAAIRILLEIYPTTHRYAGVLEELEDVPIDQIVPPRPLTQGIPFASRKDQA